MDKKEKIIQLLALIFHENWRESMLQSNWIYKSRMEKSEDEEWTRKHWTDKVDIANTKFEDLPSNWKYENIKAAEVAVNLVYEKVVKWEKITSEMIERMSEIVHEEWLERNWKEWSSENQRLKYEELSEEEKLKDRDQIQIAIQIIESLK